MRTLEVALQGQAINAVNIDKFGSAVGRLEADMTWAQASAMLAVRNSMRQDQLEALLDMRAKYTHGSDHSPDSPLAYGRQLYAQCALCHNETKDAIGPNLSQILGKKIASDDTFNNYSKALLQFASKESVWDEDLFDAFLKSPKATVPGTYMGYDGIDDETGRKALIYYLSQKDITPKN